VAANVSNDITTKSPIAKAGFDHAVVIAKNLANAQAALLYLLQTAAVDPDDFGWGRGWRSTAMAGGFPG
jgi:hypothetical protein